MLCKMTVNSYLEMSLNTRVVPNMDILIDCNKAKIEGSVAISNQSKIKAQVEPQCVAQVEPQCVPSTEQ